jgi:hypothetical protein
MGFPLKTLFHDPVTGDRTVLNEGGTGCIRGTAFT